MKAEYTISGEEYGGFPPPLIGVTFFLPRGAKLHPAGLPDLPGGDARTAASARAPARRTPRPVRPAALGVVAFGKERVPEEATIEPFYKPGGGLMFFTAGHSPVSLEILSKAHYVRREPEGFGPKLIARSAARGNGPRGPRRLGGADQREGRLGDPDPRQARLLRDDAQDLPKKYLLVKSELLFAGLGGLTPVTVPVTYKARCPRKH